jgi:hypothetical protein
MTLESMIDHTGFAAQRRVRLSSRRAAMVAEAIASFALVLSITVAMTAVSIGIARADVLAAAAEDPTARVAAAILLALVLVGIGGLTALLSGSQAKSGQ